MNEDDLLRLASDVTRFFRGKFPPGVTPEDARQDACLLLLEWRDRFPKNGHLIRKVRGVMQDRYGKLWRQEYAHGTVDITSDPSRMDTPDDITQDVRLAMDMLEARQRRAIELQLGGKTQAEIAKEMEVSQPYVSRLLREGREKLRELLEEDYG